MRVLHAALLLGVEPGISQQMTWEQSSVALAEIPWTVRVIDRSRERPTSVAAQARFSLEARRSFYRWLTDVSADFDLVLVRHTPHDPFRPRALRHMQSAVGSVHHTLEVPELLSRGGLGGRSRASLEAASGRRGLRACDLVVGVTGEIVTYEQERAGHPIAGVVYPNGAVVNGEDLERAGQDCRSVIPEILFVAAQFVPWHGLDLLLDSLADTDQQFVLHIVGRVHDVDAIRAARDRRVVLHGPLAPAHVEDLARRCHVGLSSFALDRKGMSEACTLKVREYLKYGLPVYAGHRDVFPADVDFYRQGPADLLAILDYAESQRRRSPREIVNEAWPHIDKTELLKKCYLDLETALR